LPASSFASALPITEKGSCEPNVIAAAPPPTVTRERLRKARRSMVFANAPFRARESRACGEAVLVALRVSSMTVSSDLGGAVVVGDVLAGLVALRGTLVVRGGSRLR